MPSRECPVDTIIFDFDGTLADTFDAGLEIFNTLADEFKYRRLDPSDIPEARNLSARQLIQRQGIPTRKLPSISRSGVRLLKKRIHLIEPIQGVPDLLAGLNQRGFRLGIITSNTEENVGIFLKRHGLEVFEFVRSSSRLLGKAREIRHAIKAHGLSREGVLFVGDEARDIEACNKAGIRSVGVTWGYNSRAALMSQQPHSIIDRTDELIALVGG